MTELMIITMITVFVSKVINDACSGPFGNIINSNQRQQYMDQAWESAINSAVSAAGSDADGSTTVNLPTSVTLADGTISYLTDYIAERPNLLSYFNGQSSMIDPNDFTTAVTAFSQSTVYGTEYESMMGAMVAAIQNYGDPSALPQPAPPDIPYQAFQNNVALPPNYVTYANQIAAIFTSQNIINNPNFIHEGSLNVTIDNSKNLIADINASATNYMTILQQLTNTLNNLISALATFCAAMAKCQQAVLKAPGS